MWKIALFLCVFVFGASYGASFGEPPNLCPNPVDILPCRCIYPAYYLLCQDLSNVEDLRQVAINLEGIQLEFTKIIVINSSLQYLPKELLEVVKVYEVYIKNVTLVNVFKNSPVSKQAFEVIRFENVKLVRGIIWTVFKNMNELKSIIIRDISIPTLGKDFSDNVPHGLQSLEFLNAKTRKFEKGVFNTHKSLQRIDVQRCSLKELKRDSFPVPFDVRALYFGYNNIKSIPDDLFTQMPMLKDISLVHNQLATVPESAFGGRYDQLEMFKVRENPLKCDCSLKWIVRWNPEYFDGTCAAPKVMHGKELASLTTYDFHC